MRRLLAAALAMLLAWLGCLSSPVHGQGPVVIDFEDLWAEVSSSPFGVDVTTQYASRGVLFNGVRAHDIEAGSLGMPGHAHSGRIVVDQCFSEEFCTTPVAMRFLSPQTRVKVWLGTDRWRIPETPRTVTMRAYDRTNGGSLVAMATATLGPSSDPVPVETPLTVSVATPSIMRVEVSASPSDQRWHITDDGFIQNVLSGRCIDVKGLPGTANGTPLQLWNCEWSDPDTDQRWRMTDDGFIQNVHSGKCIDVQGRPGTASGAPLQLWDCETDDPGTDQRWRILGGRMVNDLSDKCIDVKGRPGTANGTPLQLWDCEWSAENTYGLLIDDVEFDEPPPTDGDYIRNVLSGRCIDVKGLPGTASGTPLQLWDCEGSDPDTDHHWRITDDGFIQNVQSGKCIDVKGRPGTADRAPLQLWDCEWADPDTDQRWDVAGDGYLRNVRSGKCIDVKGLPGTASGAPLQLWPCEWADPGTDQRWEFSTAVVHTVRCDEGDDLQAAIDAALPGDTLLVMGRCIGGFHVTKDLTLVGVFSDATLDASDADNALGVRGYGKRVVVEVGNLTMTGAGRSGIGARSAELVLRDVSVRGNGGSGLAGEDFGARVVRSSISGNGGKGIWFGHGHVSLLDSEVDGNSSDGVAVSHYGGFEAVDSTISDSGASGLSCTSDAGVNLTRSVVRGNANGGLWLGQCVAEVHDSTIVGNSRQGDGGGISAPNEIIGGEMLRIEDSVISGNHATGDGGGLFVSFTAVDVDLHWVSIIDSAIEGNTADGDGGGIANESGARISGSRIEGNVSGGTGGGIHNSGTLELTGVTFQGNIPDDCVGVGTGCP